MMQLDAPASAVVFRTACALGTCGAPSYAPHPMGFARSKTTWHQSISESPNGAMIRWRGKSLDRAPPRADCSRIELAALPKERDELRLHALGWETANIHLGNLKPRILQEDLKKWPPGWLLQAARKMEKAVLADYADYN